MSRRVHGITFLKTLFSFLDKITYSLNYRSKTFHTYITSTSTLIVTVFIFYCLTCYKFVVCSKSHLTIF